MKLTRIFIFLSLGMSCISHASFHLWKITEVYSNADGTVQFIELTALSGGQQFISGHTITSTQPGAAPKSFTFPTNLPGDTAVMTGDGGYYGGGYTEYKSFLIGTQGFAALNVVAPDYVVPNGFLFIANGSVNFADVDIVSYASLPTSAGLSINANGTRSLNSPTNFFGITGSVPVTVAGPLDYSDMWWVGESENGWGMSIQQHGNTQFNAFYVYDNTGKPTWYVMPGGTWNESFTTYSGALYQPTSARLDSYSPSQFVVGASPGSVTLNFTGSTTATMQYSINGVTGQKLMRRQEFGGGTAPLSVGDMWWAGSGQNGWGINLVQHGAVVFGVWYTYGADGRPTWFVLPNGNWNGSTYSGPFYSTTGSIWLGATYNPAQLVVAAAGTMSFSFANDGNATMNYAFTAGPFAGVTQSKSIVRQPY